MRLLNTTTLTLESFISGRPKYAILSHTWGSEEVIFEDIRTPNQTSLRQKAGWPKIEGSCALALKDGLDWIWIDTCCIDKSSSSELSEAINSMFRWYREAEICYAYLEDVPPLKYASIIGFPNLAADLDSDHIVAIENDQKTFLGSRWFTRGWTLQELVAPEKVDFYASNWSFLGTRVDLADVVHKHTMIDKEALELKGAQKLSNFTVWNRMQWAASRETTRVEDTAYCLLGIFEINMPLLYGEGGRAFRRLQEEILRTVEDYSLMAWTSYDTLPQPLRVLSPALAAHPRDFRVMRLDTIYVSKDAMDRDFKKGTQRISIRGSPYPRLIKPNKESMLRCIKPHLAAGYDNFPMHQRDFPPPVLSARGISITMFTNKAHVVPPNNWLAWTTLNYHTRNGSYGLCIELSDEDRRITPTEKASRLDSERLHVVPFSMLQKFLLTTFYLRAGSVDYVGSIVGSWGPKPERSGLLFDVRNEATSATVISTHPPLELEKQGDTYTFRTNPRQFQRAIAFMCDPIWAFIVEFKEPRGQQRLLQFAVLYGRKQEEGLPDKRWRCRVTPAPTKEDSPIGFHSFLRYTGTVPNFEQSSILQFPWGIVGAMVGWDTKESRSVVKVMIHLEGEMIDRPERLPSGQR